MDLRAGKCCLRYPCMPKCARRPRLSERADARQSASYLSRVRQLAESRDNDTIFDAPPRSVAIPERVSRMSWASRPRRAHGRVVKILLDVVDDLLALVLDVEFFHVARNTFDQAAVCTTERGFHVTLEHPDYLSEFR